jgi:tetratricopeptide (TPR) repeat protein
VVAEGTRPVRLFLSYSHRDDGLRRDLESQLALLKRQQLVEAWSDRAIAPGADWKSKIDENLDRAEIVLLLVSADFIASDYCYAIEMQRALERHNKGEAVVIPVILRPCEWEEAPFGKLQALPPNGRPVVMWRPRDEGFRQVAKGVRRRITEFKPALGVAAERYQRKRRLGWVLGGLIAATLSTGLLWWIGGCARVEPMVTMGEALLATGRYADAKEVFAKAARWTACGRARFGLAKTTLGAHLDDDPFDPERFADSLGQLIKTNPGDPDLLVLVGHLEYRRSNLEGAAKAYETALERSGRPAEAHFGLGQIALLRNDWRDAASHFRKAAVLAPDAAHYHQNLGYACFRAGDYKCAKAQYAAAVAERLILSSLELAQVYWVSDELKDAAAQQQQAIEWLRDDKIASSARNRLPWLLEIDSKRAVRLHERGEKLCYAHLSFAATSALLGLKTTPSDAAKSCGANGPDIQRAVAAELSQVERHRPALKPRIRAFVEAQLPAAGDEYSNSER